MDGRGTVGLIALRPSLIALAAVAVVGCAELQPTTRTDPGLSEIGFVLGPPTKRFADGVPAHGAAPKTPESTEALPAVPVVAALTVKPDTIRPQPPKDTRELIGLERGEVEARLGTPALRRRDAPAEIWQYRSPLCVLDLFLYRDGAATRVTSVELRPRDGRELPAALCLSSL
jgi:hypothetical protein